MYGCLFIPEQKRGIALINSTTGECLTEYVEVFYEFILKHITFHRLIW